MNQDVTGQRAFRAHGGAAPRAPLIALSTLLIAGAYAMPAAEADPQASSADTTTHQGSPGLAEIVVTAEKREERLQDVPIPVAVLNPEALVESNQTKLQDYFSSVPGLNLTPGQQGIQNLTIRGIGFGFGNPTTGITVDDVPYGSSAGGLPTGLTPPDFDPGDLSHIEVLRGPQGTLYGASSMGGLVRYVTAEPSLEKVSGALQAGTSTVYNGAELGYNFRAMVNVPLGDTFAIRASAFTREDPGYIDNIRTGQEGINEEEVDGGHLAALWQPSQTFSIKLGALYQVNKGFGQSEVDNLPGLGQLQQTRLPNSGRFFRDLQGYSAVINDEFGGAKLTAVTGYSIDHNWTGFDFSSVYGAYVQPIYGFGNVPVITDEKERKFTQEIRLSVPLGSRVDWLLGAFYSNDKVLFIQDVPVENNDGGLVENVFQNCVNVNCSVANLDEIAAFTDFTLHFTDQFDVQIGGRESRIRQWTTGETALANPPFGGGGDVPIEPTFVPTVDVFTYLFTPRYQISDDLMVYARIASGYQPGGGGIVPGGSSANGCIRYDYPCEYQAGKTQNYEIGAKGNAFDRLISFDTSIYYIDWKDIQLDEYSNPCGCTFLSNGGGAKSEGVEVSLESQPITGLKLAAWGSYDNAVLTQNTPAGPSLSVGLSGATIPLAVKWSGNVSANQTFPVTNVIDATVGAAIGYLGPRPGLFPTAGQTQVIFPGYTKIDLHGALAYQSWTVDFSVNNLTNKIVDVSGGPGFFPSYAAAVLQPRTISLSVRKTF